MPGRYSVDELLQLRASPLVRKPSGLPPVEEWMGSLESSARKSLPRGRLEDTSALQTETFQKRPTLLESGRRSTTDPERIHLGPPRHSFASSNATRTRNHERTKTNEDGEQRFAERKSGTFSGLNGKFGIRSEADSNGDDRIRRRVGDEASDSRTKRDLEKTRWSTRTNEIEANENDEVGLRASRKFDQPWTKKEITDDSPRDTQYWRRNQKERENERGDAAPEWVDAVIPNEPAKSHTHEDFLQWMETMKNKSGGDPKTMHEEIQQKEVTSPSMPMTSTRVTSESSAATDRFFAKFEEQKTTTDGKGSAKPAKSRFASIFGAKEENKNEVDGLASNVTPLAVPIELEQPANPTGLEKKANDAAFAKLLEMLNKNNTPPTTQTLHIQSTRSPVNIAELASVRTPDTMTQASIQPQSKTPISSHTPNMSLDRLIESRSPAHHADHAQRGQAKATPQDLLDLLRRANLEDRQQQQQQQQQQQNYPHVQEQRMPLSPLPPPPPPPPGLFGTHPQELERQGLPVVNARRENPRLIFDDMMYSGPAYRNDAEYQQPTPRQQRGGLSELIAAMNHNSYAPNSSQEIRSPQNQAPPNLPPGLQRPPGLESGSRPPPQGWPINTKQQMQSQPQPQPQPQPAPTSNRVMPNFPPHQQAYPQNVYPPNSQTQPQPTRLPQRRPTNDTNLPPNFGGNIGLPPGFGPGLNFASPTSPDNANPFGLRGGYAYNNEHERERMDRQPQQQQHPQQIFPGMYGNGNRGNGGVGLPPGFR